MGNLVYSNSQDDTPEKGENSLSKRQFEPPVPETQFDYSGTYNWEVLKGKIEFLTLKTDGSITSSFSLSAQDEQQVYGTWSALPDNRLKI